MKNEINKIVGTSNRVLEINLTTEQVKELQVTDNDCSRASIPWAGTITWPL